MPQDPGLRGKVRALLPDLTEDLVSLIAVPSVSVRGYPSSSHEPLLRAHDAVARLLREAGCATESIELPDTRSAVFAEIAAPPGSPTVLLYSHYDVVGAGDESLWTTVPFEPVVTDDAVIGRGAADSKSNVIAIVGAIRAWGGRPPVGVKVVLDGMEEVGGGAFTTYPLVAPRSVRGRRRDRCGPRQRAARHPDPLRCAPRHGQHRGRGPDARLGEAQRLVRRRRARRADRAAPRARDAPRRERRRRRRGPAPGGVDRRRPGRGAVPASSRRSPPGSRSSAPGRSAPASGRGRRSP